MVEPRPKDPTTGAWCPVAAKASIQTPRVEVHIETEHRLSAALIDGSGQLQVSHNARSTIVVRVSLAGRVGRCGTSGRGAQLPPGKEAKGLSYVEGSLAQHDHPVLGTNARVED